MKRWWQKFLKLFSPSKPKRSYGRVDIFRASFLYMEGHSAAYVARELGRDISGVRSALKRAGIYRPAPSKRSPQTPVLLTPLPAPRDSNSRSAGSAQPVKLRAKLRHSPPYTPGKHITEAHKRELSVMHIRRYDKSCWCEYCASHPRRKQIEAA